MHGMQDIMVSGHAFRAAARVCYMYRDIHHLQKTPKQRALETSHSTPHGTAASSNAMPLLILGTDDHAISHVAL
jgi:hypothetical protein